MDKTGDLSGKPQPARDAVLGAFRDRLLESGFEGVRVVDLVERSGVARSTFYDHFGGREDVLRDSMRLVLQPLADLANGSGDDPRIVAVLEHFADRRGIAQEVLEDHGALVRDLLAEMIGGPAARALAIAGAQLALLGAWVQDSLQATPPDLCARLREMTAALRRV